MRCVGCVEVLDFGPLHLDTVTSFAMFGARVIGYHGLLGTGRVHALLCVLVLSARKLTLGIWLLLLLWLHPGMDNARLWHKEAFALSMSDFVLLHDTTDSGFLAWSFYVSGTVRLSLVGPASSMDWRTLVWLRPYSIR